MEPVYQHHQNSPTSSSPRGRYVDSTQQLCFSPGSTLAADPIPEGLPPAFSPVLWGPLEVTGEYVKRPPMSSQVGKPEGKGNGF